MDEVDDADHSLLPPTDDHRKRSPLVRQYRGRATMLVTLVGIALVVAACSGSPGTSETTGDGVSSATTSVEAAGDTEDRSEDGVVIVDGTTYAFSFSSPGRCGFVAPDGNIQAIGYLIDDPNRQVSILYALGADTDDGGDRLQIVIIGADGAQQWYSKVGFGGSDFGAVTSLSSDGATVTASGTLTPAESSRPGDEFSHTEFTMEITCDE